MKECVQLVEKPAQLKGLENKYMNLKPDMNPVKGEMDQLCAHFSLYLSGDEQLHFAPMGDGSELTVQAQHTESYSNRNVRE